MRIAARLAAEPFDPARELESFVAQAAGAGAVVSFVGLARAHDRAGGAVARLFLDHHPRLTEPSLARIGAAVARRGDLLALCIVHRCGSIAPGEPIVFVAAAAAHRRAAFQAADEAMDRLKTDAMFWKREDAVDGAAWIEPSEGDRADRARWSDK
jgi:molybdopterin synthase catalytic subunit